MKAALALALALTLAVACQSAATGDAPPTDSASPATPDYVFTFILTGTPTEPVTPERQQEIGTGHFANMARLAEEGHLLLAGPFADPRVDPRHRGIFLFDAMELAAAEALADTDPGAQAGVFEMDSYPFRSSWDLARLGDLQRDKQAEAGPDAAPWGVRAYVLVTTPQAERARAALSGLVDDGSVLLFGELGGERAGELLFVLDATDLDQARAMLAFVTPEGQDLGFVLHPWWAGDFLPELPSYLSAGR